uniref:Uncharacterized protein n=1 Tax=Chrysemys picta bellii TaxID=8478 RepID=A0A8C3HZ67_CHRPI
MAVTFQMLAVQHSTSKAIHTWHSARPSCQRRPASSCTRLRGMTSAATITSETAMEATRLWGTRWKARTRRMVASTSTFHRKVAAASSASRSSRANAPLAQREPACLPRPDGGPCLPPSLARCQVEEEPAWVRHLLLPLLSSVPCCSSP